MTVRDIGDLIAQFGSELGYPRRGGRVSPWWASVGSTKLYFYGSEPHRRPHVDVRGPGFNATLDVQTGEVLAGQLPTKQLRQVRQLLEKHRRLALEAFDRAFRHDFPGTLEQQLEGDQ